MTLGRFENIGRLLGGSSGGSAGGAVRIPHSEELLERLASKQDQIRTPGKRR